MLMIAIRTRTWIDCNQAGRSHFWRYESTGEAGDWWKCERCPVSTVHNGRDSRGVRSVPPPFLR